MNGSKRNVACQFLKKPGMIKNANGILTTVSPSTEHKKLIYVPRVICINVLSFMFAIDHKC